MSLGGDLSCRADVDAPARLELRRTSLTAGASAFDLAAVLCGHDPTSATGAADARADRRVWDLYQPSPA